MPYAIYILKCSDGTYYTGMTRELDARVQEHQTGVHPMHILFDVVQFNLFGVKLLNRIK